MHCEAMGAGTGIREAQAHICHRGHGEWEGEGDRETLTFIALDFVLGDCNPLCKL